MGSMLYRIINPPIKALLRSPLHGLMSGNTMIVEFTGRKSGRILSTPVSYLQQDNLVKAFTGIDSPWWRNLSVQPLVHLTLGGVRKPFHAAVLADDPQAIARELAVFLEAVPRDARFAGVKQGRDGRPDPQDVERASSWMVCMTFSPQ